MTRAALKWFSDWFLFEKKMCGALILHPLLISSSTGIDRLQVDTSSVKFDKNFSRLNYGMIYGLCRWVSKEFPDFGIASSNQKVFVFNKIKKSVMFIVLFNILTLNNIRLSWKRNKSLGPIGPDSRIQNNPKLGEF